jgi:hypothetical protein
LEKKEKGGDESLELQWINLGMRRGGGGREVGNVSEEYKMVGLVEVVWDVEEKGGTRKRTDILIKMAQVGGFRRNE